MKDGVAIVTGGGRGIGLAIAKELAAAQFRVCITGRSAEPLEQARAALAELTDVVTVAGDVAVEADVVRTVAEAECLGPVAAVVNNAAARGPTKPMHEYTASEFVETMNVNLLGAFLMIKHAVAPMLERHGGAIVNIGSIAGVEAYPLRSAYCASKWGLVGLTRTLAKEYGPHGVRVNLVAPGPTEGEGANGVIATRAAAIGTTFEELKSSLAGEIPLRRFVTAEETAAAVKFSCLTPPAGSPARRSA